jgi:hypothetical protein
MLCLGENMFNFLRKTSLYILAIPVLFTFLGAASNQLVLVANHDSFPVMWNDKKIRNLTKKDEEQFIKVQFLAPTPAYEANGAVMIDEVHCVMTPNTHLNFLADIFDMKDAIYSIGDLSLMLGEWFWAFAPFVFVFDVTRKLRRAQ